MALGWEVLRIVSNSNILPNYFLFPLEYFIDVIKFPRLVHMVYGDTFYIAQILLLCILIFLPYFFYISKGITWAKVYKITQKNILYPIELSIIYTISIFIIAWMIYLRSHTC